MNAKQFGQLIKDLRKSVMSRDKMASKYNWHLNSLKMYENNSRLPPIEYVCALAFETKYDFFALVKLWLQASQEEQQLSSDIDITQVCESSASYYLRPEDEDEVRFKIHSDAMSPTILRGAFVSYDPLKTQLKDGQMYVFSFDNALQVRRIQAIRNGNLMLISDNKAYLPQEVDKSEIAQLDVLGAVTAVTNFFR